MAKTKRQTAETFFFEHGGFNWDPKTETQAQGKRRCARNLAKAERWASDNGYSFSWEPDSEPYQCACDNPNCKSHAPHQAWNCDMRDPDGKLVQSLGCISFGPDREPWGEPYRRVVEAELAFEEMPE